MVAFQMVERSDNFPTVSIAATGKSSAGIWTISESVQKI